ncbi:hypothetical protein F5Y04DRAFT_281923 [Hypomontagnella monticulosa]|nr:hypothetical protein F5Y04DRAFT_281923 [Hypomontagnella monticulosa]
MSDLGRMELRYICRRIGTCAPLKATLAAASERSSPPLIEAFSSSTLPSTSSSIPHPQAGWADEFEEHEDLDNTLTRKPTPRVGVVRDTGRVPVLLNNHPYPDVGGWVGTAAHKVGPATGSTALVCDIERDIERDIFIIDRSTLANIECPLEWSTFTTLSMFQKRTLVEPPGRESAESHI